MNFEDKKPREYKVRGGFTLHRGDSIHHAGETITLAPEEVAGFAHMIEAAENVPKPYPAPKISPDQRKK